MKTLNLCHFANDSSAQYTATRPARYISMHHSLEIIRMKMISLTTCNLGVCCTQIAQCLNVCDTQRRSRVGNSWGVPSAASKPDKESYRLRHCLLAKQECLLPAPTSCHFVVGAATETQVMCAAYYQSDPLMMHLAFAPHIKLIACGWNANQTTTHCRHPPPLPSMVWCM